MPLSKNNKPPPPSPPPTKPALHLDYHWPWLSLKETNKPKTKKQTPKPPPPPTKPPLHLDYRWPCLSKKKKNPKKTPPPPPMTEQPYIWVIAGHASLQQTRPDSHGDDASLQRLQLGLLRQWIHPQRVTQSEGNIMCMCTYVSASVHQTCLP